MMPRNAWTPSNAELSAWNDTNGQIQETQRRVESQQREVESAAQQLETVANSAAAARQEWQNWLEGARLASRFHSRHRSRIYGDKSKPAVPAWSR